VQFRQVEAGDPPAVAFRVVVVAPVLLGGRELDDLAAVLKDLLPHLLDAIVL
jgi:hypothetical protein